MLPTAKKPKAVVLLSGGIDSSTTLAIARSLNYDCYALSFDYGQKLIAELRAAQRIAEHLQVTAHHFFKLPIGEFGQSALTDTAIEVPDFSNDGKIPVTYVPARNTIFFSIALAWAETLGAHHIFSGICAVDYAGYTDCRPEYLEAYEKMANLATKAGVEGKPFTFHAPLLYLSKAETIQQGTALGLDYGLTISCYRANEQGEACGTCHSCELRRQGFLQAGITDPTVYLNHP